MTTDKSLLPCPFCGGEASLIKQANQASVTCQGKDCKASIGLLFPSADWMEVLTRDWNTRTQPKETPSEGEQAAYEAWLATGEGEFEPSAEEDAFRAGYRAATPAAPAQDGLRERVDAETAERIKAQCHSGDEERDHGKADDILVDAIGPLTKAAFDEVDKWYA